MVLAHDQQRQGDVMRGELSRHRQRLTALSAGLDAMSPLKVLGRGYAMVRSPGGEVVRRYDQVSPGEQVTVSLGEGALRCTVDETVERMN